MKENVCIVQRFIFGGELFPVGFRGKKETKIKRVCVCVCVSLPAEGVNWQGWLSWQEKKAKENGPTAYTYLNNPHEDFFLFPLRLETHQSDREIS